MSKKLHPDRPDDDNPEWTDSVTKSAVRFQELPASLKEKLSPGQRGPQKAPRKIQTAVRYDAVVVEHFKEQGPGWQTRMNEALKKAIRAGIA